MRGAARHVAAGTLCALAAGLAAPASACNGGPLFELMDARLPAHPDKNFDVAEVDSTEGGNWDVYYGPDGKTPRFVVRTDYGESGYWQSRLIVSSPDAYAITATTYMYSAPNYTSGSTVIREEKDIFVFCKGKLYLPEEDFGLDPAYVGKAKEALKTFDAPEVKEYLTGLTRG